MTPEKKEKWKQMTPEEWKQEKQKEMPKVRFGFATGWCQGLKSRKRADAFFSVPGPMASYFHGTFDLSTSLVHSWWRTRPSR
jgi:hypothetical protein